MFKRIIQYSCLLSICQMPILFAGNFLQRQEAIQLKPIECAPELKQCLKKIQMLPEARVLISAIQKEGPIHITINKSHQFRQFAAYWDPNQRIITVNTGVNRPEGALIGSILFELHNASITSKFDYYNDLAYKGKIDREGYTEAVERLEYQNSRNTSKMAEKGIKLGIFPTSAKLPVYPNFEEHYHFQKVGGHSAWIANNFDQIAPKSISRYGSKGQLSSRFKNSSVKSGATIRIRS